MDIQRYKSTYNGIIFNRQLDDSGITDDEAHLDPTYAESDYRLDTIDPSRVTVEDFRELRQWLEGAEPNEAYEGVLVLTGRGVIHGSDRADLEAKTRAMRAAFSPALVRRLSRALDPKGSLPFDFKTTGPAGALALRAYCRPAIGRPVIVGRMREGNSRRFLFQLISFEPCFLSQTENQIVVALGGGSVTNAGSYFTKPKIRVTFSAQGAADLTITNSTTGESVVIDATLQTGGTTWVLDVRRGTLYVESNGTNRYAQRVSGYISQLVLDPGSNTFAFANTTGVSQIRVDFRDAYA